MITAVATPTESEATRAWLERAVCWRVASLLFSPPSEAGLRELRALEEELPSHHRETIAPLTAVTLDDWAAEYHARLGPGALPATESAYDDNALAGRGPLLADVAGFYEAFAYRPDIREVPDHLSVELGFLSYLALKAAFAAFEGHDLELELTQQAYADFYDRHPASWLARFGERLDAGDSPFYEAALAFGLQLGADLLARFPAFRMAH